MFEAKLDAATEAARRSNASTRLKEAELQKDLDELAFLRASRLLWQNGKADLEALRSQKHTWQQHLITNPTNPALPPTDDRDYMEMFSRVRQSSDSKQPEVGTNSVGLGKRPRPRNSHVMDDMGRYKGYVDTPKANIVLIPRPPDLGASSSLHRTSRGSALGNTSSVPSRFRLGIT